METTNHSDSQHSDDKSETEANRVELQWKEEQFTITALDDYTFEFDCAEVAKQIDWDAPPETYEGSLSAEGQYLPIQFRPRRVHGQRIRMGFFDLPIKTRERLQVLKKHLEGGTQDELHELSYDELATGATTKDSVELNAQQAKTKDSSSSNRASSLKKMVAMMVLVGAMLLIVGWVFYLVQSRSTVAVSNSVMVGNYLSINTPQQSQLVNMLVESGQAVQAGQTLAVLSNDEAGIELVMLEAKLTRARLEAEAYEREFAKLQKTFRFAEEKISRDIQVVNAEIRGAEAQLQAAQAQLTRIQPLLARGNVALAEYDEAKALVATAEAENIRQTAVMETLRFAQEAAKSEILVSEKGATNPMGQLETKISLAKAAVEELEMMKVALQGKAQPIEVTAPADGTVYAIYRKQGETLKVADEMLAISAKEGGWATGHVAAYLAPELKPGQPVEVEIPSLGITTTGKIEGIGHRAVYGRGGYNAEFRGGPLEVPIRVAIDLDGQPVPSGMRLHMSVRIRDHLKDFKNWVGRRVAWVKGKEPSVASESVPAVESDEPQESDLQENPGKEPVSNGQRVVVVTR